MMRYVFFGLWMGFWNLVINVLLAVILILYFFSCWMGGKLNHAS